jgi:hypothetical protein
MFTAVWNTDKLMRSSKQDANFPKSPSGQSEKIRENHSIPGRVLTFDEAGAQTSCNPARKLRAVFS